MVRNHQRFEEPIDPEQIEFLAAITTGWEYDVDRNQREAAEAASRTELQEFVDAITGLEHSSLDLAPTRDEVHAFVSLITGCDAAPITEGSWNPAKHPRRGGPPNAGWWASTSANDAGAGRSAATQSFSNRRTPKAILTAWHAPVGHHWIPAGVTQQTAIRPLLSDEAVQYAAGAYSGPTSPNHGNTTFDEVTHRNYNKAVRKELETFIKKNGISKTKKMTSAQMKEFADLMEKGLDVNGNAHSVIGPYNKAIKGTLQKGVAARSSKLDDVIAAGRKYMKNSRFRFLAAGAVVSGLLGEAVAAQVKVLDVAAKSGYYDRALRELRNGNLDKAQHLLIGEDRSLYAEILGEVGALAALNFKQAMEKVFKDAANRDYN